MSEPCPEVVARFYDAAYAHVRDGAADAFNLEHMAATGGPPPSPSVRAEPAAGVGSLAQR